MSNAEHADVRFPPPLLFLACLLLALGLNAVVPLRVAPAALQRYVGPVIAAAGFALAFWAVLSMRRAHTSPDPYEPTAALVTGGPYRATRNPIYVGFTLIVLGLTLTAGTWWGVLLLPILVLAATRLIIHAEEVYLRARFGQQYEDYTKRVRRWI